MSEYTHVDEYMVLVINNLHLVDVWYIDPVRSIKFCIDEEKKISHMSVDANIYKQPYKELKRIISCYGDNKPITEIDTIAESLLICTKFVDFLHEKFRIEKK